MSIARRLAASLGVTDLYVEDVFQARTRIGSGASQANATGLNMFTYGGMLMVKDRLNATETKIANTIRGGTKIMYTCLTAGEDTSAAYITSFDTDGYTLGTSSALNTSSNSYVDWSFRVAPKFYYQAEVVVSGSNQTVDLSSLGTVGMVWVKLEGTSAWYVWHRSLTAGKLVYLNTTAAETTDGSITLSGTTLTLVQATIGDGTYMVYAWAHDDSATGIIRCGTFTADGSGNATVTLGWEPQYLDLKVITAASTDDWYSWDTMRPWSLTGDQFLRPNTSGAETASGTRCYPTATGFVANSGALIANKVYIYMVIRRGPMKLPTVGTQVYNAIARTGTSASAAITGVGFPPDLMLSKIRSGSTGSGALFDRLRGKNVLFQISATDAEANPGGADVLQTSFDMDGATVTDSGGYALVNHTGYTYINEFFRRYPGVFDVVCDTGTGSAHTVSHNLTVVPELMIRKKRSAADAWCVYYGDATDYLILNTTAATVDDDTFWNDTAPTASVFTVGTHDDVNGNTATFVTYLAATLAGISKVGTYTGNGTTQTIDCGFSTGARFVFVKAYSTTGDWPVGDSVRGLVAGDDPYLLLNTTGAEVTNKDWLDTDNSGFVVNETTGPNANTNAVTYVYWAIA